MPSIWTFFAQAEAALAEGPAEEETARRLTVQAKKEQDNMVTNVLDYLEASAARWPDKEAYMDQNGSLTFGQLRTAARAVGTRGGRPA